MLLPNVYSVPSSSSTAEANSPAATECALAGSVTMPRTALLVVLPLPSWPASFEPSDITLPSSSRANACLPPSASCATGEACAGHMPLTDRMRGSPVEPSAAAGVQGRCQGRLVLGMGVGMQASSNCSGITHRAAFTHMQGRHHCFPTPRRGHLWSAGQSFLRGQQKSSECQLV